MVEAPRRRVRIICHLPVEHAAERKVANSLFRYLKEKAREYVKAQKDFQEHKARSAPSGFEGFTHSVVRPSSFVGYYWGENGQLYREAVATCTIDYVGPASAIDLIDELAAHCRALYTAERRSQVELWIIAHEIDQYRRVPRRLDRRGKPVD